VARTGFHDRTGLYDQRMMSGKALAAGTSPTVTMGVSLTEHPATIMSGDAAALAGIVRHRHDSDRSGEGGTP
jgi:hypothetical protein